MLLIDGLGAALSAIALLFLGASGYLLARPLLGPAMRDPLALAIGSLLAATAEAESVALLLGKLGLLRIELTLLVPVLVTVLLLRRAQARGEEPLAPAQELLRRAAAHLRERPLMSLIALHALGFAALRGLLLPPLSWDSVMDHLPLAATWLQDHAIGPVFGMRPMSFYGLQPAGGSVWLWWWIAPSHSELYANLSAFPHALLLALAAGGIARELGARRQWPLAAFLTLLAPVVIRFADTQYVDLLVGSMIAAALFFALRWLRHPTLGEALLLGAGVGVAASAKVLGLAYGGALCGAALLLARGDWRRRTAQLAAAGAVALALASVFYVQTWRRGGGLFTARCAGMTSAHFALSFPEPVSLAGVWPQQLGSGRLLDVFLGTSRAESLELGLGPQALLLVPALWLPLLLPRGARRVGTLVWSQIALQLLVWVTIPNATGPLLLANLRYLDGALALALAGLVAAAEIRGMVAAWLSTLAIALLVQDLLLQHVEPPRGLRIAVAILDVAALAMALSPRLRGAVLRRRRAVLAAAALAALLCAPLLGRLRAADRARAFREEMTLHTAPLRSFAGAWGWLDAHGGDDAVAVVASPVNLFFYPDMGPHLERRVLYVNATRADDRNALHYPGCDPRSVPLDPEAWRANLRRAGVRWVHIGRLPGHPFPPELDWAAARPQSFALRYQDPGNAVLELLAPGAAEADRGR